MNTAKETQFGLSLLILGFTVVIHILNVNSHCRILKTCMYVGGRGTDQESVLYFPLYSQKTSAWCLHLNDGQVLL